MKKVSTLLVLVGLGVALMPLFAMAQDACVVYHEHGGTIPGNYDYAVFIEDQDFRFLPDVHFQQTVVNPSPGHSFSLSPSVAYIGNGSWDTVKKCNYEVTTTTTTTIQETTTTVQDTTTLPEETTTTQVEETTTVPEVTTTTAQETTTTVVATTTSTSDTTTTVVDDPSTTIPTTTTVVVTTTTPDDPELPFTGMNSTLLCAIGLALILVGGLASRVKEKIE